MGEYGYFLQQHSDLSKNDPCQMNSQSQFSSPFGVLISFSFDLLGDLNLPFSTTDLKNDIETLPVICYTLSMADVILKLP